MGPQWRKKGRRSGPAPHTLEGLGKARAAAQRATAAPRGPLWAERGAAGARPRTHYERAAKPPAGNPSAPQHRPGWTTTRRCKLLSTNGSLCGPLIAGRRTVARSGDHDTQSPWARCARPPQGRKRAQGRRWRQRVRAQQLRSMLRAARAGGVWGAAPRISERSERVRARGPLLDTRTLFRHVAS